MTEQEVTLIEEEGIRWIEYTIASIKTNYGYEVPEHPGIPPEHWGEKIDKNYVWVKEYLPKQQI